MKKIIILTILLLLKYNSFAQIMVYSYDQVGNRISNTKVGASPLISEITNQTIISGESFKSISLDKYVIDALTPDSNIVWSYSGTNHLNLTINTSRVVAISFAAGWVGNELITFVARNQLNLTDTAKVLFTVKPIPVENPVINIPNQITLLGTPFATILLDNYAEDNKTPDALLQWQVSVGTHVTVSIDANHIATAGLINSAWFGTDSLIFTCTDLDGNVSKDTVAYTVQSCNIPSNWTVVNYPNSTTIYGIVTVNGSPAGQADRVAAFVGNECRANEGVTIHNDTAFVTMNIQGISAETASFKVFQASSCQVYNVNMTQLTNPGSIIGLPPNYVVIQSQNQVTQNFNYNSGWNLFSLNVHPFKDSIGQVFSPVLSKMLEIKNIYNNYNPNVPPFLNTLNTVVDGDGYYIKMNAATSYSVTGTIIDLQSTSLQLKSGWNLVAYLGQNAQSVEAAFATLISSNKLVLVKNINQVYNPSLPSYLNTLNQLQPSIGYWVNVSDTSTFTYPAPSKHSILKANTDFNNFTLWQPVVYTNSTTAYGKVTLNNLSVNDDAIIGVFAGNECRAISKINNFNSESYVSMVINGTLPELLTFKLYYNDTIYESGFSTTSSPSNSLNGFLPLTFNSINTSITQINNLNDNKFTIQPNPFFNSTKLLFNLNKKTNLLIKIYNNQSQLICILKHGIFDQGKYEMEWDGFDKNHQKCLPGVFYIILTTDETQIVRKAILLNKSN